jgi:hypothetical protein
MSVRRGAVAGLVGLVLVVGASGCGQIGEKIAEEAVEQNTNCDNVDIDASEGGFSGDCEGEEIDVNASGNASLPDDWPADLAPPEGANISSSTSLEGPPRTLGVIAGIDGDPAAIYSGIKDQLTAAGYTIESDISTDDGGGTVTATGPEWTANVIVSTIAAEALDGNVGVTYSLTAL